MEPDLNSPADSTPRRVCACGAHHFSRKGSGPTGRVKQWMILVDDCMTCGQIHPIHPERLTYAMRQWVERYNRRIYRHYLAEEQSRRERQAQHPQQTRQPNRPRPASTW